MSQSSAGKRRSIASVTGLKPATSPATLMPVRPAAPAGAARAPRSRAPRGTRPDIVPVATLPIVTGDAAVSALAPGAAPFACSRNAARFT